MKSDGPSNDQAVYGSTCSSCGEPASHLATYYDAEPPYGTSFACPYCGSCASTAVASTSPPRHLRLMDWAEHERAAIKAAATRQRNRQGRPRLPGI